ncbi:MAG: DUF4245 domain-containing protein [Nocardioidaceae bacterium]
MSTAAEEPDRPRRVSLIGDPLRTTAVLLAIIAVLAGAQQLLSAPPTDPVRPVEYASKAESARTVAPFEVLAPPELPEGWRATSVRFTPGDEATWHLGILTDEDKYVGVEQAVGDVEALLEEHAAQSEPAGSLDLGGDTWQLLRDGDETTLVRDDGGSATLVTGDAPQADVERLAASLRA